MKTILLTYWDYLLLLPPHHAQANSRTFHLGPPAFNIFLSLHKTSLSVNSHPDGWEMSKRGPCCSRGADKKKQFMALFEHNQSNFPFFLNKCHNPWTIIKNRPVGYLIPPAPPTINLQPSLFSVVSYHNPCQTCEQQTPAVLIQQPVISTIKPVHNLGDSYPKILYNV